MSDTPLYEAEISGYKFQMFEESCIEVWANINDEFPFSTIVLRSGDVKNKKDFDYEISDWYMKNN